MGQPLPDQNIIENSSYGVVATDTADTTSFSDSGALYTTTVNAPEWQISKSVTPAPTVQPGDYLTYTITITNSGHLTTTGNYTITDQIPNYTSYVAGSASPSATFGGGGLTWVLSDPVGINQSVTATYAVTVTQPLTDGTPIVNQTYSISGGNVYSQADGAPITVTVESPVTMTVVKTDAPDPVQAGALLTYTITVTNGAISKGPAEDVVVADTLPENTSLVDAGFVGVTSGTTTTNGSVITWTITSPNSIPVAHSVQLTATVRVSSPLTNNTTITNTCTVTAANALAPSTCAPLTSTVASAPSLSLGKLVTPSTNVTPAGTVTYTLVISNTGNETATGVAVTDTLDSSFTPNVVTWTNVTVSGRPTYGTVGTQTLVFTATVPVVPGTYYNPAITATYASTVVTATNLAPITVGTPDLRISKSAALTSVVAGEVLTYTVVYSNAGDVPATGVRITDTLDANLTFVGASPSPDVSQPPDYGWNVGDLNQSDGEQTIVVTATVPSNTPNGTVVTNSAVITSAQMVGDSDEVTATVQAPELHVVKSDAGYDPIDAGAVLTYTIAYSNTGDAIAHNVRITDTLDANVTFAWASTTPVSTSPVVLSVGDVPAQSGLLTQTIVVTVASPLTNGTTLQNDVVIKGGEPFSDSDSINTTVQSAPLFQVGKSASPSTATPGQPLTYTIVFTNVGNAVATGVQITDTLDSNVTLQNTDPVSSSVIGNQVTWAWPGSVGLNDPQTITVTVQVTSPLADGTLLGNTVDIASSQGATDTVTINTPVQSQAELHVTKTATPTVVQPGETITYTITYSNSGTAVTDVVITDTLDSNVNFSSATPPPVGSPPPYTWTVTGLSPLSNTQVLTVVVTAGSVLTDGTSLVNQVMIAGGGSSDTDTVTTTVQSVDLSISKSADPANDVQANSWITYTIAFSNAGGMDATNVRITDTLPVSLTNVVSSASPGISFVGGPPPYAWNAGTVSSAETGVITITGQLTQSPWSSTGAWLVNTVVITGDRTEAVTSNNTANVANLGLPGDPYTITLTAVPTETMVGNVVPVTATITDQWGNPVRDGLAVNFQTSLGTLLPGSNNTQNGVATSTITSTVSGLSIITGTIGGRSDTITVTFNASAPHHFVFTPTISSPQTAGVPFSATVVVVDIYGNGVPTYTTSTSLADTTGTMLPTSTGAGWSSGVWSGTVTITQAMRNNSITATQGVVSGTSNLFDVRPGPAATAILTVTTPMSPCGATEVQTTTVRDSYGNLLWAGTPITFYLSDPFGTGASLVPSSPYVGQTNDSGLVTTTVQSSGVGVVTVLVDVDGTAPPVEAQDNITISGVGIATDMQITANPSSIVAGNTSVVTVTLRDCAAQPVSGANVGLTVGGLGSLLPTGGTSNGSGIVTSTFTAGLAPGTAVVTATSGSLSESTPITITGGPVFTITKTAVPTPGTTISTTETITYFIVVTNTGTDASGFTLTDVIPANSEYVSGSASTNGSIVSQTPNLVVTHTMNSGTVLTVTFAVTPTGGGNISNQAVIASDQTTQQTSSTVSHLVAGAGGIVYLPIVVKNWDGTTSPTPTNANLIVQSLSFLGSTPANDGDKYHVQVVVRNVGTDTVTTDFWVDLYLNPVSTPSPNQPWQSLSQSGEQGVNNCPTDGTCYGRAWFVTTDLDPGDVITLTTQAAPDPRYDRWPTDGVPYVSSRHNPIVALVDSWGFSYGAIYENNEGDNLSGSLSGSGLLGSGAILGPPPIIPPWPPDSPRPSLPGLPE